MSTLIDRLRTLIIDRGELQPDDVLMLSLVAGRLEHLESASPVAKLARLGERIQSLEAELNVANDCRAEAVRGAEVERVATGLILKYEESERDVRDTRKDEWPRVGCPIFRWSTTVRRWQADVGDNYRCSDMLWLPAPPPPDES